MTIRTKDKQGRSYAKLNDLKDGQIVWLDGGFVCCSPGPVTVHGNGKDACFDCAEGRHGFDGQCEDNAKYCIGVYPINPGPMKWECAEDDIV